MGADRISPKILRIAILTGYTLTCTCFTHRFNTCTNCCMDWALEVGGVN
jgi:hypothetical protein